MDAPRPVPASPESLVPSPADLPAGAGGRVRGWDVVLVTVMGLALLGFGWMDARDYLHGIGKPEPAFTLTTRPGGFRVEPAEFYRNQAGDSVRMENFCELEYGEDVFRQAFGPVSTLQICTRKEHGWLKVRYENPFEDQDLVIACNGVALEHQEHLPKTFFTRNYPLPLHPGNNVVTFTYRRYNHDGAINLPDGRLIGGTFHALNLYLE